MCLLRVTQAHKDFLRAQQLKEVAPHNMRMACSGPSTHHQQAGPDLLGQASSYTGNMPLQGGDLQRSCPQDNFSMHRHASCKLPAADLKPLRFLSALAIA